MQTSEIAGKQQKSRRLLIASLLLCGLVLAGWWQSRERAPDFGPPPDFAAIKDVPQMKAAFYAYLTPIVQHHNDRIKRHRQRLLGIHQRLEEGHAPGILDRWWLEDLAQRYEIDWNGEADLAMTQRLLRRVDIVPLELALVQAAKESGWGRSRFAVEANNFFGQWCYQPGCGVVPANRAPGRTHEVERFASVSEGIRRYMNNLNSHERYARLRAIRATLRASGQSVDGLSLASALTYYSERRDQYVRSVRAMIQRYRKSRSRDKDKDKA